MVSQHQHIVLVLIATLVTIASITFASYRFLAPFVNIYESYNGKLIVKSTAHQPLFFPQVAYFLEDGGQEIFPYERKIIEINVELIYSKFNTKSFLGEIKPKRVSDSFRLKLRQLASRGCHILRTPYTWDRQRPY
jgi:hypothetical protein